MKNALVVTGAVFGLVLGITPAPHARAATFNAPGLTAPVRDGPSLSVNACAATRTPEMARTSFTGTRGDTCCKTLATTCPELLSTTRMQLPRRATRT